MRKTCFAKQMFIQMSSFVMRLFIVCFPSDFSFPLARARFSCSFFSLARLVAVCLFMFGLELTTFFRARNLVRS